MVPDDRAEIDRAGDDDRLVESGRGGVLDGPRHHGETAEVGQQLVARPAGIGEAGAPAGGKDDRRDHVSAAAAQFQSVGRAFATNPMFLVKKFVSRHG